MNYESLFGPAIGAGIALIGVYLTTRMQLSYDREKRQEQFAHEKAQEIRGRKTKTLEDMHALLWIQRSALRDLWLFIQNPENRSSLFIAPDDAWNILLKREYGTKAWAIPKEGPLVEELYKYASGIGRLMKDPKRDDLFALMTGNLNVHNPSLVKHFDKKFESLQDSLKGALSKTNLLIAEINNS